MPRSICVGSAEGSDTLAARGDAISVGDDLTVAEVCPFRPELFGWVYTSPFEPHLPRRKQIWRYLGRRDNGSGLEPGQIEQNHA